ncbi:glycoside hydrolase family 15 protein [Natronoglycomyces albus]|uniref:Glycoside hydrolase family 15 protein n=1 Tax=Natronoglycomyces albus TaxID=2811108 RepID=A0A895XXW8_9ACTN|nr:glycoside hydrolase family 15 protein [Natronoglycomyces albus]QSB06468.1 glycoside hydrolase family 15 protein [Natronoglycomyces albus]
MRADGYLPIEDYAVIGNLRSAALVGRDGSIDWCPLPRLDSASVFAAILDHRRGGRFRVGVRGDQLGSQRYRWHTNVLETSFDEGGGRLVVTDCMPLAGNLDGVGQSTAEPAVHRLLRAEGGDVEVRVEWSPRFQYANGLPQMLPIDGGVLAWAGSDALTLSGVGENEVTFTEEDGAVTLYASFTLGAGQRRALVTKWGSDPVMSGLDGTEDVIAAAVESWRRWVHKAEATGSRAWAAPHEELIIRAELVLKLLTNGDTGAIAAAATTSLPEEVGGVRNWDYRYSWIRDASLAAQALRALGHDEDALAFAEWAERVARDHRREDLAIQIVYGLHGETEIGEAELPNLEGYRRSAPVRTGNGAVDQLQLDVFGELISVVYELVRARKDVSDDILEFLPAVADSACRHWNNRDFGIWELRRGPFHFVYSKVMVWMGLDRAITLASAGYIDGRVELWSQTRDQVRAEVLQRGFDPNLGAFRQSYERNVLDASNLLFGLLEFLPFDDPRVRSTVDAALEGLTENGLAHRYFADDGIAGGEGAFGLCNFWLVDVLAMSGRVDEARDLFERMVSHANHVGLYSEELDPATGTFLGNFPQAFTHIGLINSALYLAYAEGRKTPVPDPIGSPEHRQRRLDKR